MSNWWLVFLRFRSPWKWQQSNNNLQPTLATVLCSSFSDSISNFIGRNNHRVDLLQCLPRLLHFILQFQSFHDVEIKIKKEKKKKPIEKFPLQSIPIISIAAILSNSQPNGEERVHFHQFSLLGLVAATYGDSIGKRASIFPDVHRGTH